MLDKHLIAKTDPVALQGNMVLEKDVRITVLTDRLFRIEQEPEGHFCDQATQTVWYRRMEHVPYFVERRDGALHVITDMAAFVWRGTMETSYVMFGGQEK